MKETKNIFSGVSNWNLVEFDSLSEFYNYLNETPTNESFKKMTLSSQRKETGSNLWSGTNDYKDAVDLFKNGWTTGAEELTKKIKLDKGSNEINMMYKNFLSVCGYQAVVPLYLQGVPNNMVNKKPMPIKNKIITINKVTSVSAGVSSKTLMDESIKCFQIIKKIEASGYRVNLNLMMSTGHVCVKIRLKSAGEKLNISKLAFPLVHTSMFRRLYFRFVEVYPTIPKSYCYGYGKIPKESEFKNMCSKNEVFLPTLLEYKLGYKSEDEIEKLTVDQLIEKLTGK